MTTDVWPSTHIEKDGKPLVGEDHFVICEEKREYIQWAHLKQ